MAINLECVVNARNQATVCKTLEAKECIIVNTELLLIFTCKICLLYTSPSPRDRQKSRMPSSA